MPFVSASLIDWGSLEKEGYCYLTTLGRVTGRPHEIEIWFALKEKVAYLLSGGGLESDWVKNLRANPQVNLRIGTHRFQGNAYTVSHGEEEMIARRLLAAKYYGWRQGDQLNHWARTALPVVITLSV
ncbi:MAG: nitroreductase family deazaflavin-dependent oxidoreductase [Anaerolineales bacterium]